MVKNMNLYEQIISEFGEEKEFWNYYGHKTELQIENKAATKSFIYKYFQEGSKGPAIDYWAGTENDEITFRNAHTVNVFFIGAILQRTIDCNLCINAFSETIYPFSYMWFLTCLAHDFGYIYETVNPTIQPVKLQNMYRIQT